MDRLIVLDQGRIVEEGRHDALIEANGVYAHLWRRQSGGFIDAIEAAGVPEPTAFALLVCMLAGAWAPHRIGLS